MKRVPILENDDACREGDVVGSRRVVCPVGSHSCFAAPHLRPIAHEAQAPHFATPRRAFVGVIHSCCFVCIEAFVRKRELDRPTLAAERSLESVTGTGLAIRSPHERDVRREETIVGDILMDIEDELKDLSRSADAAKLEKQFDTITVPCCRPCGSTARMLRHHPHRFQARLFGNNRHVEILVVVADIRDGLFLGDLLRDPLHPRALGVVGNFPAVVFHQSIKMRRRVDPFGQKGLEVISLDVGAMEPRSKTKHRVLDEILADTLGVRVVLEGFRERGCEEECENEGDGFHRLDSFSLNISSASEYNCDTTGDTIYLDRAALS